MVLCAEATWPQNMLPILRNLRSLERSSKRVFGNALASRQQSVRARPGRRGGSRKLRAQFCWQWRQHQTTATAYSYNLTSVLAIMCTVSRSHGCGTRSCRHCTIAPNIARALLFIVQLGHCMIDRLIIPFRVIWLLQSMHRAFIKSAAKDSRWSLEWHKLYCYDHNNQQVMCNKNIIFFKNTLLLKTAVE